MRLADRIAQARTPLIVECCSTGKRTRLSGASDCANEVANCAIRYVLSDELTRLCAALAYSRGARTLACDDLINVPAQKLWVEWAYAPWQEELDRYEFPASADSFGKCGRRGALICAARDGRRGLIRTFWCIGNQEHDVCASAMLAHFDFDLGAMSCSERVMEPNSIRVAQDRNGSLLGSCFTFKFEDTWANYYKRAGLSVDARQAIERHSLGTIALDMPVLLSFFLLLNTRNGLPQSRSQFDRLNRARCRNGKAPLLEHIDVRAPFAFGHVLPADAPVPSGRRRLRLHHVRGHLVRRRNQLFWRVPHLRGNASVGVVKSRTVTWAFDQSTGAG